MFILNYKRQKNVVDQLDKRFPKCLVLKYVRMQEFSLDEYFLFANCAFSHG